jgi:putative membrane protein
MLGRLCDARHTRRVIRNIPRSILGGFLMGTADLVPGVSGGTIALVLGIYERLVASIREASLALGALLRADMEGFRAHLARVEWPFVLALLSGILLAVILLSSFLESQLDRRPTILAAAFFGLVVGSAWVAWRLLKSHTGGHYLVAGLVGIAFFAILGGGGSANASDPGVPAFFGAGVLAICAMILPGISGSLILVLIGMYGSVLGAVNGRDLTSIGVFVAGAVIGLALFSQLLHWALENHHDVVLAGLVGLMLGSLRILWPWPDGVAGGALGYPSDDWVAALVATAVGLAAVFLISNLGLGDKEGG